MFFTLMFTLLIVRKDKYYELSGCKHPQSVWSCYEDFNFLGPLACTENFTGGITCLSFKWRTFIEHSVMKDVVFIHQTN